MLRSTHHTGDMETHIRVTSQITSGPAGVHYLEDQLRSMRLL